MEKSSGFKVGFPIGAVFFGSLVGPSMISGIYAKVYFVPYGAWAFVFALSFPLICGFIVGFSAELARRYKVYDYNSFCRVLYGRFSPVCTPLMELYMLMAQILTLSAVVSMGGTFMHQIAGWPPLGGALFLGLTCLILVLRGAAMIRRLASLFCVLLAAGFALLTGAALYCQWEQFAFIVSAWYVPPEADLGFGTWRALLFGFSGACNGMVLCALMQKVETRKHSFATGLWSFILTAFVLFLEVMVILPYTPDVMASDVPTMWIIQNFLIDILPAAATIYFVVMFFALLTSGVPAYQAIIARAAKTLPAEGFWSRPLAQRLLIGVVFLGVVLLISRLGLTTIVSRGYSTLGAIGIPLIAIPTCVLAPLRWRKERKLSG
ncbi:MAG: hypothetical protein LBS10_04375 [Gracilibacteraceae bacterium]|jgi:uncharacterized membrane protein YkvI|nr:hypothetical protein [Gracilibacteraceae bacterium]